MIPRDFVVQDKMITLSADVFFVYGIALVLTLTCWIKFVTIEHTLSRTNKQITVHLKRVLRVYHREGFTVRYVLMNGEFENMKNELPSIVCNTTATKEHVAKANRQIRVVKERCRGSLCTVLYYTSMCLEG